jgi:bifunctional DNA-binding transcriptional regulator/antitoxin component of YhaV-PrlF toxin-antitoxin module
LDNCRIPCLEKHPKDLNELRCSFHAVSLLQHRFKGTVEQILYHGENYNIMVKNLETGVEVKKVDSQGRLILPADWREAEIGENRELYIIKRKGYLKIVPKRKIDLTENFDKVDLGVESIGNWKEFQKKFYEAQK